MNIKTYISKQLQVALDCAGCVHAKEIAWNAYNTASGAYEFYTLENGRDWELFDWWDREVRPMFLQLAGINL